MKIYNLPLTIENIEIYYFKNFKFPKKLKIIRSKNFYQAILESIDNEMFYLYKLDDNYYGTKELSFDDNIKKEGELFIINIPNIYIHENNISYVVNILDLITYDFEKNIQYEKDNVYIFFKQTDIFPNFKENDLKLFNIDKVDPFQDNSLYDILINNKKTSFIGLNPNIQIILDNKNIIDIYIKKLFELLKILSIVEKFYKYKNLFVINSEETNFCESFTIYNIFNKNLQNIKICHVVDIIDILKKSNDIFYI